VRYNVLLAILSDTLRGEQEVKGEACPFE